MTRTSRVSRLGSLRNEAGVDFVSGLCVQVPSSGESCTKAAVQVQEQVRGWMKFLLILSDLIVSLFFGGVPGSAALEE